MSNTDIISLVHELKRSGARLSMEDEQLVLSFTGPKEARLVQKVRENKAELIDFLRSNARPAIIQAPKGLALRDRFPLTRAQQRIWLLQCLEPENKAYYIHTAVRIKGQIDFRQLSSALTALVAANESLRTIFILDGDRPVQKVLAPDQTTATLEWIDSCRSETGSQEERVARDLHRIQFELNTGPLYRFRLYPLDDGMSILSCSIHHIIADAESLSLLVQQLLHLYGAGARHELSASRLPAGTLRDLVDWEQQLFQTAAFARDREYWEGLFPTPPPPIDIPLAGRRPDRKTYRGAVEQISFSAPITARIHTLCRQEGITPFNFFYALVNTLLVQCTGQYDLTIGTSVHGRDRDEWSRTIGLFARTLPLRLRGDDRESFRQQLHRSSTVIREALEHQQFPFDLLLETGGITRDPSRSPFFDIMIDLFHRRDLPAAAGLEWSPVHLPQAVSKFDLTFTFFQEPATFSLALQYNDDLFEGGAIVRLLSYTRSLLDDLLADPDRPVGQASLIAPTEIPGFLAYYASGPVDDSPFVPVKRLFETAASTSPDFPAVGCGDKTLSYAELNASANAVCRYIRNKLGRPQGRRVAIMLRRSEQLLIALLGVVKSGAAFVPVDPDYPAAYRAHVLSDSAPDLLITDSEFFLGGTAGFTGEVFAVDLQLSGLTASPEDEPAEIRPTDQAYLLYTSGSTGAPKGVEISQASFSNYIRWATDFYYEGMDRTAVPWFTSFCFDLSLTSIFTPLVRGDRLEIFSASEPALAFLQLLEKKTAFGLMKITPSHINLLHATRAGFPLERVIVGGEELTAQQIHQLRGLYPDIRIFNEYGPTETTVGCTVCEATSGDLSIGRPIANTSVYILNPQGRLIPPGNWGEIFVGGAGVALGYRNRPELTAERFIPDPFPNPLQSRMMYRTGDIGRWLPDGRLEFRGRMDSQLKIHGHRVEAGEIENRILRLDGISQTLVLIRETSDGSRQLTAFYGGAAAPDESVVREQLMRSLPAYMIPAGLFPVSNWPLTPNGKIDRVALLRLADHVLPATDRPLAGQTEEERQLVEFFEALLGVRHLSPNDNLFTRGLDSLKVVQAQSRLEEFYPGKIQVYDLFSHPTVRKLAERVCDHQPVLVPAGPALIDF